MDDNTTKVVMAVIALISAIVTPLVVVIATRMQNKKIDVIENKLDENHRLTNGHMTTLLKTTKDLATMTEKNKHSEKK